MTISKIENPSKFTVKILAEVELLPVSTALGKIIVFTSLQGGAGRTTTAYGLSNYLNELGYSVLAIDLDGQGNLTERFFKKDMLERFVFSPARKLFYKNGLADFNPLVSFSGVSLLPTHGACHETTAIDLLSMSVAQTFAENLEGIAKKFDFIVVDTPSSKGLRTLVAQACADYRFVPVVPGLTASSSLVSLFESLQKIGQALEVALPIDAVIPNQIVRGGDAVELEEIKNLVGGLLLNNQLKYSNAFKRSLQLGMPMWHSRKSMAERNSAENAEKVYAELALRIQEVDPLRVAQHFTKVSKSAQELRICELARMAL